MITFMKKKIAELNEEISRLKNGIKESAEELEDFIKEQNAWYWG